MKAFSNMTALMSGKPEDLKQPRKKRKKEEGPRDLREARFRNEEVYPFLKSYKKIKDYKRIENGICHKHGKSIPDFIFWTEKRQYWLELKAPDGVLLDGQAEFRDHCIRTGEAYILARTIKDIINGIEKEEGTKRICE